MIRKTFNLFLLALSSCQPLLAGLPSPDSCESSDDCSDGLVCRAGDANFGECYEEWFCQEESDLCNYDLVS